MKIHQGIIIAVAAIAGATLPAMGQTVFQPKKPIYTIKVKTTDKRGAGTDSNIDLTMSSSTGSYKVRLNPLLTGNAFESGDTDTLKVKVTDPVGHPTKVTLKSDKKYSGSDWHVEYVQITSPDGHKQTFRFNKWIEDDGRNASLTATASDPKKPWSLVKVDVITGSETGAGTDSNIHLTLFTPTNQLGRFRATDWVSGNAWENGDTDSWIMWADGNLAPIDAIELESDGRYGGADWFPHKLKVTNLKTKKSEEFLYDRWIKGDEEEDFVLSQRLKNMKFSKGDTSYSKFQKIEYEPWFNPSSQEREKEVTLEATEVEEASKDVEKAASNTSGFEAGYSPGELPGKHGKVYSEIETSIKEAVAELTRSETKATQRGKAAWEAPADSITFVVSRWEIPIEQFIGKNFANDPMAITVVGEARLSGKPTTATFVKGDTIPKQYWEKAKAEEGQYWPALKKQIEAHGITLE